jgi:hypothetical protein
MTYFPNVSNTILFRHQGVMMIVHKIQIMKVPYSAVVVNTCKDFDLSYSNRVKNNLLSVL